MGPAQSGGALAGAFLLQSVVFLPVAMTRFADDDEGGYLLASRLVVDGRVPYADFLHTQMPLLPYVFGAWASVVGEGWQQARLLAAFVAIAIGMLLYVAIARTAGTRLALIGVVVYTFSSLAFGWFTTVKTHGLATLFLFAAYLVVSGRREAGLAAWLAGGVLAGLAVDTRLMVAAAIPAFLWSALRGSVISRTARFFPFVGGFLLGLLPTLVLFAIDHERFLFDNIGYHQHRSSAGLVGDFGQKVEVTLSLFGVGTTEGAIGARAYGPQYLLLFLCAVVATVGLRLVHGRTPLAGVVVVLMMIASLAPTPAYTQYFSVTIPFLILLVAQFAHDGLARLGTPQPALRHAAVIGGATALAVYCLLGLSDVVRYARVPGADDARLGRIEAVARTVDRVTTPNEKVLATWPGYLIGTHAGAIRGYENDFAHVIAADLTAADANRYHLRTSGELEELVRTGGVRVIVLKRWHLLPPVLDWERWIAASGRYRLRGSVGDARIYVRGP